MPTPIRSLFTDKERDGADLSFLESIFTNNPLSAMYQQAASGVSDPDAELIFKLWDNSKVLKSSSSVEGKIYAVPGGFGDNNITRLARLGFVTVGPSGGFSFTAKSVDVIKTFVLAEKNNFEKKSVKKPFSIILAESKMPKRKSRLALANSQINLTKTASGDVQIPGKVTPYRDQVYIYNNRLIFKEGTSDKEYTVRVYISDRGPDIYEVWAFNGRTNGTQIPHPKGEYNNRNTAQRIANENVSEKRAKGYTDATDFGERDTNRNLPGVSESAAPARSPARPAPSAPRTTRTPSVPVAPPEKTTYTDAEMGLEGTGYKVQKVWNAAHNMAHWKGFNANSWPITGEFPTAEETIAKVKDFHQEELSDTSSPYIDFEQKSTNASGPYVVKRRDRIISRRKTEKEANQAAVDYIKSLGKKPEELGWQEKPPKRLVPKTPEDGPDDEPDGPRDEWELYASSEKFDKTAYNTLVEKAKKLFASLSYDFKSVLNRKA